MFELQPRVERRGGAAVRLQRLVRHHFVNVMVLCPMSITAFSDFKVPKSNNPK
jgi:hypothetical protein